MLSPNVGRGFEKEGFYRKAIPLTIRDILLVWRGGEYGQHAPPILSQKREMVGMSRDLN